jgi:hypothetical protein
VEKGRTGVRERGIPYYAAGAMKQAAQFAARARRDLTQGTADWERANDKMGAAASQAQQRQSDMAAGISERIWTLDELGSRLIKSTIR